MFQAALGAELDVEIIARSTWNAGYTLVAEKFQSGRVFLCGDAAHLFTPTGGLGYNTAAVLKGWGGPGLLKSYEIERQALARRNTNYARHFADSVGLYVPPMELEDDTPEGRAARKIASDHFNYHARFEFNIPGITFGGRYDGSPIVVADGTASPPDKPNEYLPTGCPGGRAPHLWLDDEHSLYDAFGFEFTFLRLGAKPPDATPLRATAQAQGLPLKILEINTDEARDLYGADLALVRPDQIVAWRGNVVADAVRALQQASGQE
jgi:FAD binding domain